jgi:tetratricopeptide (TPR) repeat protein
MNTAQNVQQEIADALGLNSKHIAALLLTGHRFYQQERLEEARKIFEGLSVLDNRNPYVQGILGSIYQKQKQYDLALTRYNNSIALFPEDINTLTNRGEVHVVLGKFQEAALDFKKAIQLDPQKKDPAANRARLLVSLVQNAVDVTKQNGLAGLEAAHKQWSAQR